MSLACEDANSKLVKVVTIANVNHEDRDGNSLLHTLSTRFGEGFEVEVKARFLS